MTSIKILTCELIVMLESKTHILKDVLLPLWVILLHAPGTAQYLLQLIIHSVPDMHYHILLEPPDTTGTACNKLS